MLGEVDKEYMYISYRVSLSISLINTEILPRIEASVIASGFSFNIKFLLCPLSFTYLFWHTLCVLNLGDKFVSS